MEFGEQKYFPAFRFAPYGLHEVGAPDLAGVKAVAARTTFGAYSSVARME